MTDRVTRLRQKSLNEIPSLSLERAELVTQVYKKYHGKVSVPVLRALTFESIMVNKKLYIGDDELIVGERGEVPAATPTYPELCCHTINDFEVINDREKISFAVDQYAKKIQQDDIIPFWQGRSIRDKLFDNMSPEWIDCYTAGIFTEFMEQRAPGHTVADDKIYKKGFSGFIDDIKKAVDSLDFINDDSAFDRREELKAMKICADAIIKFGQRYAESADEMAEAEQNSKRRDELYTIAEICRRVPLYAPRNFREAIQMYWFVHIGVISELNTWDSFNPGRLDQHLYPFYKRQLDDGSLSTEDAKELLECLWVKFHNQPAPPKVGITLKESGTYTDFANINIGGLKRNGRDGVNPVSYILLDVIDEMKLLQPGSNIQLSSKSPDKFLFAACDVIKNGRGQPSVFNAEAVAAEMLRCGKSIEDALEGGTSGCVETGAFGKESYILTGYFNLPKVLEITLNDGVDPRTGSKIGINTGNPADFKSFDELFDAFKAQMQHFIDIKLSGNNIIETLYAKYMPSPFLSIIISDCIEKGVDYNAGGARYNTRYIQGVGIGSITDSLSSIFRHVYKDKTITMTDLLSAVKDNFDGHDVMKALIEGRTPHYGNDDERADDIMTDVFTAYRLAVEGHKSVNGADYRIDMLPTTCHVYFGSVTGATTDGRLSGKPLSEGISPVQGRDANGPTAVIKSAARMEHIKTGGTLLNMKFSPSLLQSDKGIKGMAAVVRAYFQMDGHHIQFNVVSADILKKAQNNPDEYKNLIVRVAGYSDYFSNLNLDLQNEIIARTEHMVI